jgi:riboflavin kinase/FMN adenylyltransferase
MRTIRRKESEKDSIGVNTAIALGNFDGLHIAHMEVISAVIDYAKAHDLTSMVYTFSEHPKNVTDRTGEVRYITPTQQKEAVLKKTGLDILYLDIFTPELMKMTPEAFLVYLKEALGAKFLSVGYNYTFGYKASGDVAFLEKWCSANDVELYVAKPVYLEGKPVSSSRIRKSISVGNVELAVRMLGRPYFVSGCVEHGRKLGTSLGFPTVNTKVNECSVLPKFGVYVTHTFIDGVMHKSITNIGIKPTIGTNELTIETYIIDFEGDLYGKDIRVDFLVFLRDEKKFASYEALSEQIASDVETARAYEGSLE